MLRLLILTILSMPFLSADPLDRYQWKNRLIVFALPSTGDVRTKSLKQLTALQREHAEALVERDMLWIDLSEKPTELSDAVRPKGSTKLREKLNLVGRTPTFALLGKDGGVKDRQSRRLDLAHWFRLIDSMPMRQREMRE